jgi:hypothetical protein
MYPAHQVPVLPLKQHIKYYTNNMPTDNLMEEKDGQNEENPERTKKVKSIVKKAGDSITRCQPENNG